MCIRDRFGPSIAFQYLPYKQIRPLFLDMYHVMHPKNVSLEHIVPQSLFKSTAPEMSRDMHNLMLYPVLLNSHRSNYRYSNELVLDDTTVLLTQNGEKTLYTAPFNHIGICLKSNKKRYFYPRPFYRGKIARACMYMAMTYPEYQNEIFTDVIDPYVLLTWHHEHPVSGFEIRKNQPNLSPIMFYDPDGVIASSSFTETQEEDRKPGYTRGYINVSSSFMQTHGGKVSFIELSYQETGSQTDTFNLLNLSLIHI